MKLSNVEIMGVQDEQSTFTMKLTREFIWADAAARNNDISKLWNPAMMYSFPNAIKVEQTSPDSLEADGQDVSLAQHLRVTFANKWNFTAYPMDAGPFVAEMWSGFGTDILEPVTVLIDPVQLPGDVFGYKPTSKLTASILPWGEQEGSSVGQSQMVTLSVQMERIPSYAGAHIALPVTLCVAVAYAGFFINIEQLMPRLATAVIALLILSSYMRVISTMIPQRSYLCMAEYWLIIQAVLIAIGCCHHSAASYINERQGSETVKSFDHAMRWCFPVAYIMSFFVAYFMIQKAGMHTQWGYILAASVLAVLWLFFIMLYSPASKPQAARKAEVVVEGEALGETAKAHYPGI